MDSLIAAAARALVAGDVLGALKHVALRDDPPALALRGIAMAQLGEHPRARALLRRAARAFGPHDDLARARCVVAEAEVALAMRDLGGSPRILANAVATLEARADRANAAQARLIAARRLLLIGRIDAAAAALNRIDLHGQPPALLAEVGEAQSALERPAARCVRAGGEQVLRLAEVEALLATGALAVDACRRGLRTGADWIPLARRAVLFTLAQALAEAWPDDVDRHVLIARAFRTRRANETHRARLRVEIGRLRRLAAAVAHIVATERGFALTSRRGREVVVLLPPIEGEQGSLLALLADGGAWSTSALALALGASQRTVQRALVELELDGRVRSIGRARARRWLAPPPAGFTTSLLLPAALPPA